MRDESSAAVISFPCLVLRSYTFGGQFSGPGQSFRPRQYFLINQTSGTPMLQLCKPTHFFLIQTLLLSIILSKLTPTFLILAALKWNDASHVSSLGWNSFLYSLPCSALYDPCPNLLTLTILSALLPWAL